MGSAGFRLIHEHHVGRQRFVRYPRAMSANDSVHIASSSNGQRDSVADRERSLLSHALYPANEFSGISLELQIRRHRRIDRSEEPGVLLNHEVAGGPTNDRQIVKRQLVRLPLNANDEGRSMLEGAELFAGQRTRRLGRQRRLLAEPLSENAELRFRLQCDELVGGGREIYSLDVELRGEQWDERDQGRFRHAGRDADHAGQAVGAP